MMMIIIIMMMMMMMMIIIIIIIIIIKSSPVSLNQEFFIWFGYSVNLAMNARSLQSKRSTFWP